MIIYKINFIRDNIYYKNSAMLSKKIKSYQRIIKNRIYNNRIYHTKLTTTHLTKTDKSFCKIIAK